MLRDEGRRAADAFGRGARRRRRRAHDLRPRQPARGRLMPADSPLAAGLPGRRARVLRRRGALPRGAGDRAGGRGARGLVRAERDGERAAADAAVRAACPGGWRSCCRRRWCWCSARSSSSATVATVASLGPRAAALQQALDPTVVAALRGLRRRRDGAGQRAARRPRARGDGARGGGRDDRARQPLQHRRHLRRLPARRPAFFGRKLEALVPDPDRRARARAVLGAGRGGDPDLPLGHDRSSAR